MTISKPNFNKRAAHWLFLYSLEMTSEEEAIGVFIELENEKPTEHTPRTVSSFLQPLESSVYFIFSIR